MLLRARALVSRRVVLGTSQVPRVQRRAVFATRRIHGSVRAYAAGGGDGETGGEQGQEETPSAEEEEPQEEEEDEGERIARERKAKTVEETDRYNREMIEYQAKMKALRSQFMAEYREKKKERLADREERLKKAAALDKIRKAQRQDLMQKFKEQRTDLELKPTELIENAEQRKARLAKQREEKAQRRRYTYEKLIREAEFQQRKRDQLRDVLAREAVDWIGPEDLENEERFQEKIKAKLVEIQPITATFANALPKHHFEHAETWASSEESFQDFHYFYALENEDEPQSAREKSD